MPSPRPAIAAVVAASLLISIPLIGKSEGKRNDPYIDMAGIPTVCYGETNVKMRHYTDAECIEMLRKSVEGYTNEVITITPALAERPYELAAVSSLAYNTGVANYKRSTMAKLFAQKRWNQGCSEFAKWVYVKGKKVKGLIDRRKREYAICVQGTNHN